MPSAGPILDYASPRPRGRLRLPAKSFITWKIDPQGGATVIETLGGKNSAVVALLFGAIILIIVGSVTIAQAKIVYRHRDFWPSLLLPAGAWLGEFAAMIAVIDQTWAKTTIRATRDQLTFTSRSPLRRRKFAWNAGEVAQICLVPTQNVPDGAPLAEIEIAIVDRPGLKLFTDHLYSDLEPVAQAILHGLGRCNAPVDDQPVETPAPVHHPDAKTFDRLTDAHRKMRGRRVR